MFPLSRKSVCNSRNKVVFSKLAKEHGFQETKNWFPPTGKGNTFKITFPQDEEIDLLTKSVRK